MKIETVEHIHELLKEDAKRREHEYQYAENRRAIQKDEELKYQYQRMAEDAYAMLNVATRALKDFEQASWCCVDPQKK